ncbi:MAG TPA: hypothetical protein EYP98_13385, partial [Planctomycetes bacterium]|nr:hypothetical protein [Planctomycetota bacterium]
MRILSSVAILAFSALAFGQSPLTTTFANNNGNAVGGAAYVDLDVLDPTGVTIFSLDINTAAAAGSIEVYTVPTTWVGNNSNAAAWTLAGSGSFSVGAGMGTGTSVCMAPGFHLPQGQYGIAFVQIACNAAYTTASGGFPLVYATAELSLTGGGGTNVPFSTGLFQPRLWNGSIHYEVGTTAGACLPNASKETFGDGCYSTYASFYEVMDTASFDLTNTDLTATNAG